MSPTVRIGLAVLVLVAYVGLVLFLARLRARYVARQRQAEEREREIAAGWAESRNHPSVCWPPRKAPGARLTSIPGGKR